MSYFLTDVIIEKVSHKVSFGGKNYEYFIIILLLV